MREIIQSDYFTLYCSDDDGENVFYVVMHVCTFKLI